MNAMHRARRSLALLVCLVGSWLLANDARAEPTKAQCVQANESAQTLRKTMDLREARAQLLACISPSCPSAVRADCVERLDDVERAMPTVVFVAKGFAGEDLANVRVTMDGAPMADHLDGSALSVNPGAHTFELTAAGLPPVTKKLLVREGEKARQEVVVFAAPSEAPSTPPATAAPIVTPPPAADAGAGDGQRTVAFILGGAGLVGLGVGTYFGFHAKSTYDEALTHCLGGWSSCDATGVHGNESAHGQANVSTAAFIAGGVLLTSAVVVYLTASKSNPVSVQASVGPSGAGLGVGGRL
jgi:hypothetical protein